MKTETALGFTCEAVDLSLALQKIRGAVSANPVSPVLHNILIAAEYDGIVLKATNNEIWITARIKAEVSGEWSVAVNFSRISDFVGSIASGLIDANSESGKFVIKCGKSRIALTTIPADSFPKFPEYTGKAFAIEAPVLSRMIEATKNCAAQDKVRGILTGVLFKLSDKDLEMVATDGRRLGKIIALCKDGFDSEVIIPLRIVTEIQSLVSKCGDASVKASIGENGIRVEVDSVELVARAIEGKFPNYKQVIPSTSGKVLIVDTKSLLSAIKRAAMCSDEISGALSFSVQPGLVPAIVLESANQLAEFREEVVCEYTGEAAVLKFNRELLRDAVDAMGSDKLKIGILGSAMPIAFKPSSKENLVHIVMPMRI